MNMFEEFLKEGYSCTVKGAEINEQTGDLVISLLTNFVVPQEALASNISKLKDELKNVNDVTFDFEYQELIQPRDEAIENLLKHTFIKYENTSGGLLNSIASSDVEIKGTNIKIKVLGETAAAKLNEDIASFIKGEISSVINTPVDIIFVHDTEQYEQLEKKSEERIINYKPQKIYPGESKNTESFDGVSFLGKIIEEEPVSILETNDGDKGVVVEGEVFDVDVRTGKAKQGRDYALVTFAIYDGEGTMPCKVFFNKDKWDAVSGEFEDDIYVRVKGNVAYDEYARRILLDAKSIQLAEKRVRTDEAAEKRVELHAHTKMSDMDGLSDPAQLVKTAADWGHKAIAITDHGVVQAFPEVMDVAQSTGIKVIYGMEGYVYDDKNGSVGHKDTRTNHIILLAKSQKGVKDLYEIVSESHLNRFYYKPRIPKSMIAERRDDLIIGSACVAGEFFGAILAGESDDVLCELASFYDYLEIMPLANNQFLVRDDRYPDIKGDADLAELNRKVIEIGKMTGIPVVATCDAHYINEEDAIYRKVLQAGQHYDDADEGDGLYLRTTDEMKREYAYLDEDTVEEIVVKNSQKIAAMIEDGITPIAAGKFPPKIPDAETTLRETCEKNAKEKYGDPLPQEIQKRLDRELDSIIGNGYAVMYVSAKMLVEKSNRDGYVVGSRGSVGSSFAATMSGITEVNPLPAHYICPNCKRLEWGDPSVYECGIDMPFKECPDCGHMMDREGTSIPFETFLGFEGNKEPDIDLNFAGEYQATAHKYVEEIFGTGNVYKAGTISTVKYLTAKSFTEKYYEERGRLADKYEVDRIANHCVGVKRTTGQHPGGIIIVPDGHDITEFCPVQRPANDSKSDITTTHFDYHSIDENLLKLDILGHDAPSIIKQLYDLTGVDPMDTPMDDPDVNALFVGTDSLDIKYDDYHFKHGSYGIPEFGTSYVRQMLDDTTPTKFADLVRISGLSHGTNVWTGNAQEFIRNGQTTIEGAICTRDDIMNYLINQGLPSSDAFTIMEAVRKGKGLKPDQEAQMTEAGVEPWYIDSCNMISYMFPRAHAVAYVTMSYRIAYFKVHHPAAFYAAFLSTKLAGFNWDVIRKGRDAVYSQLEVLYHMERSEQRKKETEMTVYEIVYEMMSRGYEFEPPKLDASPALRFTVRDGRVVVPLCALDGVGESVGQLIEEEKNIRPFSTIEDLQTRAKVNKSAIEMLKQFGVLDGLPESDQLSLF